MQSSDCFLMSRKFFSLLYKLTQAASLHMNIGNAIEVKVCEYVLAPS